MRGRSQDSSEDWILQALTGQIMWPKQQAPGSSGESSQINEVGHDGGRHCMLTFDPHMPMHTGKSAPPREHEASLNCRASSEGLWT